MTAQMAERLVFRGGEYMMFAEPLEAYFAAGHPRPESNGVCSACWRGYVGTWEFRDDVLYLTDLHDPVSIDGPESRMAATFPDHPNGLRADWCTDLLRLPCGEMMEYVHMGYGSAYERDLMLTVHAGRLVYLEEVDNRRREVVRRELTPGAGEVFPGDDVAFLRAVAEAGWADAPKLVYADWLDERADPRGELIRVEVERPRLPKGDRRRAALAARRAELYRRADWVWVKAMGFDLPRDKWGGELPPAHWERFAARDRRLWDRTLADGSE